MHELALSNPGWRALAMAALLVMTAAFCGSHATSARSATERMSAAGPVASCQRPSPTDKAPGVGGPEVIGHGTGAHLWGLIQARFPLVAGPTVVKIVWRMTGRGPLKLAVSDSHGHRIPLVWGPDIHGASNYARPGQEWGAGYRFEQPGCYRLTARRTEGSAEVWLRVGPRSR